MHTTHKNERTFMKKKPNRRRLQNSIWKKRIPFNGYSIQFIHMCFVHIYVHIRMYMCVYWSIVYVFVCVCAHMYACKREHVSIFLVIGFKRRKREKRKELHTHNKQASKLIHSYRQVWKSFISYLHAHLLQHNKSPKRNENAQIQNENKKSTNR